MSKKYFILTGHTDGLGFELSKLIIKDKNNILIGISKRKINLKTNYKNFYQFKHNFKDDAFNNQVLKKIILKINKQKCYFILNAGINMKDTFKDFTNMNYFTLVYKINFHNQVSLILKFLEKNLLHSVTSISSYNIFSRSKLNKGYTASKKIIYNFSKIFNETLKKIDFKTVILSSIDTKMFHNNKYFTHYNKKKKIPADVTSVAKKVYKFLMGKQNIFFYNKLK